MSFMSTTEGTSTTTTVVPAVGATPQFSPAVSSSNLMPEGAVPSSISRSRVFGDLKTRDVLGKKMTTVMMGDKEYLIGVQIAHFLKRETFNLYRSMKLGNIEIIKCQPDEIEELTQIEAIKRGIHSVTLVPYEDGVAYVSRELKRKPRKKSDKRRSLSTHDSPRGSPYTPRARRSSSVTSFDDTSSDDDEYSDASSVSPTPTDDHSGDEGGSSDEGRLMHWKKLLLVATMEHMRLNEETQLA